MGDSTYLPVGDGRFLCLATVLDCFSRCVVGYSIADHMRTELVADTLRMVRDVRGSLQGAVFHSDHVAQYTSKEFSALREWARSRPDAGTLPMVNSETVR